MTRCRDTANQIIRDQERYLGAPDDSDLDSLAYVAARGTTLIQAMRRRELPALVRAEAFRGFATFQVILDPHRVTLEGDGYYWHAVPVNPEDQQHPPVENLTLPSGLYTGNHVYTAEEVHTAELLLVRAIANTDQLSPTPPE